MKINLKSVMLLVAQLMFFWGCDGATNGNGAKPAKAAAGGGSISCPDQYTAVLETTKGSFEIEVHKAWAPLGAARFCELVKSGYFTDVAFFRVIDGFIAQAGIHGDPSVNTTWRSRPIADDPVKQSNVKGTVTFAMGGPGTRTTQFFINLADNKQLDKMGFAAFGKVTDMTVPLMLYAGYGEGVPRGEGPSQMLIQTQGNSYLKRAFPKLDYIKSAHIK